MARTVALITSMTACEVAELSMLLLGVVPHVSMAKAA